jgi:ribosomal protein L7/L12
MNMDKNTAMALLLAHMMKGNDFDYKVIASKLCAEDPVMFAKLAGLELLDPSNKGWESRVITFLHAGNNVGAIKEVRTAMVCGLKEAKDVIDYFRHSEFYCAWDKMAEVSKDAVDKLRNYTGRSFF